MVIGLHHLLSHSTSRSERPWRSTRSALEPYHCGRSQVRAWKNSAPRSSWREK